MASSLLWPLSHLFETGPTERASVEKENDGHFIGKQWTWENRSLRDATLVHLIYLICTRMSGDFFRRLSRPPSFCPWWYVWHQSNTVLCARRDRQDSTSWRGNAGTHAAGHSILTFGQRVWPIKRSIREHLHLKIFLFHLLLLVHVVIAVNIWFAITLDVPSMSRPLALASAFQVVDFARGMNHTFLVD